MTVISTIYHSIIIKIYLTAVLRRMTVLLGYIELEFPNAYHLGSFKHCIASEIMQLRKLVCHTVNIFTGRPADQNQARDGFLKPC